MSSTKTPGKKPPTKKNSVNIEEKKTPAIQKNRRYPKDKKK